MNSLPKYPKALIGPSILSGDLSSLTNECKSLVDAGADYLHLDVMDGHFVPNLTIGHPVIKCLRKHIQNIYFDAHMMVSNPKQWIESMSDAGVNQYTFHLESNIDNVQELIRKIKEANMNVGIGIKPDTDVKLLEPYINDIDVVLIMTVEPGFGGQKFMPDMMTKVKWIRENFPLMNIEVDGGITLQTVDKCGEAGANLIVSGSALIDSKQRSKDIELMRHSVEENLSKKFNIKINNNNKCNN
ncbi:unnamed protein product [Didymodactylos carnosus]|uniref:Ribulose-phosphate 3-epimerase n=1 Tax=Didymodactylos carnosus TaxID=1234261 RepID=A0A813V2W0_9BILA|nr:unnamed protein product [Didymodactylos carnosus]CAF1022767.1 unnamed protein product [Didymodactylos carnosus]CAF3618681.1 unnamed protein product [Didymodactylos carnosus]CAF3791310.1 unnamed protein product [Didymodactylos carnosus]